MTRLCKLFAEEKEVSSRKEMGISDMCFALSSTDATNATRTICAVYKEKVQHENGFPISKMAILT